MYILLVVEDQGLRHRLHRELSNIKSHVVGAVPDSEAAKKVIDQFGNTIGIVVSDSELPDVRRPVLRISDVEHGNLANVATEVLDHVDRL